MKRLRRQIPVAWVLAAGIVVGSCGSDGPTRVAADGGADVPGQTGDGATTACLDMPGQLPRLPAAGLPCELLPPGLRI